MPDQFDQASQIEQQQREQALKRHQTPKESPLIISGVRVCKECEEPLLIERVQAVNAVRCINCQEVHELVQRQYRR